MKSMLFFTISCYERKVIKENISMGEILCRTTEEDTIMLKVPCCLLYHNPKLVEDKYTVRTLVKNQFCINTHFSNVF